MARGQRHVSGPGMTTNMMLNIFSKQRITLYKRVERKKCIVVLCASQGRRVKETGNGAGHPARARELINFREAVEKSSPGSE